jgi:hypothetical protein
MPQLAFAAAKPVRLIAFNAIKQQFVCDKPARD